MSTGPEHPPTQCLERDDCHGEAGVSEGRERTQRSEPRERSEPAKRLARERVGESEWRSPSE